MHEMLKRPFMAGLAFLAVIKVVDYGTFRLHEDVLAIEKEAYVLGRMESIVEGVEANGLFIVLFLHSVAEGRDVV